MALQDREPRSASRVPVPVHAADGEGRALLHRRHAPRGRGASMPPPASCCGCTASTRARARAAAPRQLSGRGLAYWTDGKEERILYVTVGYQMVALDAKTGDPRPELRQERHRRSEAGDGPGDGSGDRRGRPALRARSSSKNIIIIGAAHREGGAPKSKTNEKGYVRGFDVAHRQAAVDLPHHSRARRVRQRHLGEGLVELHRQHRRLGADERRRGARPGLPAGRAADRRLLRRPSSRQQPVRREPRRRRPARPASASGTTSSCTTASGTTTSRARRSWRT